MLARLPRARVVVRLAERVRHAPPAARTIASGAHASQSFPASPGLRVEVAPRRTRPSPPSPRRCRTASSHQAEPRPSLAARPPDVRARHERRARRRSVRLGADVDRPCARPPPSTSNAPTPSPPTKVAPERRAARGRPGPRAPPRPARSSPRTRRSARRTRASRRAGRRTTPRARARSPRSVAGSLSSATMGTPGNAASELGADERVGLAVGARDGVVLLPCTRRRSRPRRCARCPAAASRAIPSDSAASSARSRSRRHVRIPTRESARGQRREVLVGQVASARSRSRARAARAARRDRGPSTALETR